MPLQRIVPNRYDFSRFFSVLSMSLFRVITSNNQSITRSKTVPTWEIYERRFSQVSILDPRRIYRSLAFYSNENCEIHCVTIDPCYCVID
ncbi:hypothetical protein X777_04641 [Ooceraea biroi]|uniref:Uncharacterized protein n=1 Tax=Ooceraea biroi TaxID=2015173 RepID=A0A026X0K1_OOCBI|nr:hypothetical protein X777_04641 [Ooceraea biroi]